MNWVHPYQWVGITAPLTSGSTQRTPELLQKIVAQFGVEIQPRYRATEKDTWCNIFVSDVTKALACEVPHWWNGKEMTANASLRWLWSEEGKRNGWNVSKDAKEAAAFASKGFPVVVGWENREGPGHVAVVLPSTTQSVEIAQAGRVNFARGPIEKGFGNRPVLYFLHN